MNYYRQLLTVTLWEYRRFYKLRNELLGILIMLIVSAISYSVTKYALSGTGEPALLMVDGTADTALVKQLQQGFRVIRIQPAQKDSCIAAIQSSREGILLTQEKEGFSIQAWKSSKASRQLQQMLNDYHSSHALIQYKLTPESLNTLLTASISETYFADPKTAKRKVLAYFFAGLMLLAVFLSFAYQFTAITGEKQLRITEQIVSAIRPQVWMDGKILGITLTGMSSMITYSLISILGGMLYMQFTGTSLSAILQYLHLPSILLFLPFTITGIMIWNALLAGVASAITDPNNSGKSSLMMLPLLFVLASFLVIKDPDSDFSVFLSWFPLTSATAMPVRWVTGYPALWEIPGALLLLFATFYLLRKLSAKIFHVSILMSGKEPGWKEIMQMIRERN